MKNDRRIFEKESNIIIFFKYIKLKVKFLHSVYWVCRSGIDRSIYHFSNSMVLWNSLLDLSQEISLMNINFLNNKFHFFSSISAIIFKVS